MQHSAGLLPYTWRAGRLEVFLVHMGGPLWARRDDGGWSIAKGLYLPGEEAPEEAARREFAEEVGVEAPVGDLLDLGELRTRPGKLVRVFAVLSDAGLAFVRSGTFTMVWPPRSGRVASFPEVDRGAWFSLADAAVRLVPGQVPFLGVLAAAVGEASGSSGSEPAEAAQQPDGHQRHHRAGDHAPGEVDRHHERGEVPEDRA